MSAAALYPWLKAFHVVAVISWLAGLLYLPRLFVYHSASATGSTTSETFKVMERRLMNAIMMPAMLASWILGLALIGLLGAEAFRDGYWLIVKLALVACLTGVHLVLMSHLKAFATDRNRHSQRYFRILNEVPTVLLIAIVVLVIVRPF